MNRGGLRRNTLIVVFSMILLTILAFTVRASLNRNILDNGSLVRDVWFQATLADAYLGFLTFYVWVFWKENRLASRLIWFVLIMTLGNIAMSIYVLLTLFRLPPGAGVNELLTTRRDTPATAD